MFRMNAGGKHYLNTLENLSIERTANMALALVITVSRLHHESLQFQV